MRLFTHTSLLAALLLLPAPLVLAQSSTDPSGHWEGAVQAPTAEVKIEIDLTKNSRGELEGTFGQPAQNLRGLALSNLAADGPNVRFQIKGAPGDRAFEGALAADGKSMSGNYTQNGYTMPFSLTRTGDARIEAPRKNGPIGKELEGTWNGTLAVDGAQRRLVMTLSNLPDTATGSIVSVEEGLEIPISAITQKDSSLILEVNAIGGTYAGTFDKERRELVGTWTQGPAVLPLTFRPAKP